MNDAAIDPTASGGFTGSVMSPAWNEPAHAFPRTIVDATLDGAAP